MTKIKQVETSNKKALLYGLGANLAAIIFFLTWTDRPSLALVYLLVPPLVFAPITAGIATFLLVRNLLGKNTSIKPVLLFILIGILLEIVLYRIFDSDFQGILSDILWLTVIALPGMLLALSFWVLIKILSKTLYSK